MFQEFVERRLEERLAILWREQRVLYSIRLPVLLVMTCRNFGGFSDVAPSIWPKARLRRDSCRAALEGGKCRAQARRYYPKPADAIVDNFDYGVSAARIAEQFEIPPEGVQAILTYAQSHRFAHPV